MSIGKKLGQLAAGLLAAGILALAAGTWVFPEEKDTVAALGGFRVSVMGIGAGLSLLTELAFAGGWIAAGRKARPEEDGPGRLINGLGFGLLPAAALWKIFEQKTSRGQGLPLPEGIAGSLPDPGLMAAGGRWLPGSIETILALLLFAGVILWLAMRRERLPETGDLPGVCLASWAALRLVTAGFREGQELLPGTVSAESLLALAALIAGFLPAAVRLGRRETGRAWLAACIPVLMASAAAVLLIQHRTLETGNAAADLILQAAFALLALKAVLCAGRVSRRG